MLESLLGKYSVPSGLLAVSRVTPLQEQMD